MAEKKGSQKGGRKSRRHGKKAHSSHHTRKASSGMSWPQFAKKTYEAMKKTDKSVTFKDALIQASKLKKQGKMN